MAAKGTGLAYTQLRPIQADFGDPMERYADRMIASQDKKRAYDEARRKENKEMMEKFGQDMASLENVITGVKSIDEINYDFYNQGKSELGEMYRQLQSNPNLGSDPQFMMKKMNLLKAPVIHKAYQDKVVQRIQTLTDAVANGTASKWMEQELSELQAQFGQYDENGEYTPQFTFAIDKKTGESYAIIRPIEDDPNTPQDETRRRTVTRKLSSVINGYEYGEMVNRVNLADAVKTYTKDILGDRYSRKSVLGGTASVKEWNPEIEQSARQYWRALLTEGKQPSAMAKSIWMDHMEKDSRDVNIKEVEDFMVKATETAYDQDPIFSTGTCKVDATKNSTGTIKINLNGTAYYLGYWAAADLTS